MAGRIIEIKYEIAEILHGFAPYKGIYDSPHQERNQDPYASAAYKLTGRVVDRELEIAGSYNEERHTGTHKRIKE
jgi:hypothetical protein